MVHYTLTENELCELCEAWMEARRREIEAEERRRELERQIRILIGASRDIEGTYIVVAGPYSIEVSAKARQEVDTDMVFRIAYDHGLTCYLPKLFRWYAEVNKEGWQRADEEVTGLLEAAIKTGFGRPSFIITKAPEESAAQVVQEQ